LTALVFVALRLRAPEHRCNSARRSATSRIELTTRTNRRRCKLLNYVKSGALRKWNLPELGALCRFKPDRNHQRHPATHLSTNEFGAGRPDSAMFMAQCDGRKLGGDANSGDLIMVFSAADNVVLGRSTSTNDFLCRLHGHAIKGETTLDIFFPSAFSKITPARSKTISSYSLPPILAPNY